MDPQQSQSSHKQNQLPQQQQQMQAQNQEEADDGANNNDNNGQNGQNGEEEDGIEQNGEDQNGEQNQQIEQGEQEEDQMEQQGEVEQPEQENQNQEPKQNILPQQNQQKNQQEMQPQVHQSPQVQSAPAAQQQIAHKGDVAQVQKQKKNIQVQKQRQTQKQKNLADAHPQPKNIPTKVAHAQQIHGQKPEHAHKQQKKQQKQLNPAIQKYVNQLQSLINQKQSKIKSLITSLQTKDLLYKTVKTQNQQYKNQHKVLKDKIQQMDKRQSQTQEEITLAKNRIQQLQDQINGYKQIGDIGILKRRVEQLEGLTQAQVNQLKILKQYKNSDLSMDNNQQRRGSGMMSTQYMQKMEKLQSQKDQIQARLLELQISFNNKNKQNTQNTQIMNKMDEDIKKNIQRISELEDQLRNQRTDRIGQRTTLQNKVKQLQFYIQQNINEGQNDQIQEKQRIIKQKQEATEEIKKQKDIVFRQYLKLELNFNVLQQSIKQMKNKYQQACKQLRLVRKDMVTKKDYQDVLMRYKKTKQCLEKAISQNRLLRSNGGDVESVAGGRIQTSLMINQQDNGLKQQITQLNQHVKKSVQCFKQSQNFVQKQHFQRLKQQLNKKQKIIDSVQSKNQGLQTLNTIFQRQLIYKNSLMERVIQQSKRIKKEYYKLKQQKVRVDYSLAQNLCSRGAYERLQAKSANLILRNREIVAEKDNWKHLYERLKQKYQLLISRDPTLIVQQKKVDDIKQTQKNNERVVEEGQIDQEPVRNRTQQHPKQLKTSQAQTDGLSQLYYKQIKQTLSALKKFPDRLNNLFVSLEQNRKVLQDYKKKYEDVLGKFNLKFRALQNEKNENDSWRQTTKRQLISQYQDIRELVENDRLLECLRKAKNLIEQLEQGQGQEGQASAE